MRGFVTCLFLPFFCVCSCVRVMCVGEARDGRECLTERSFSDVKLFFSPFFFTSSFSFTMHVGLLSSKSVMSVY